MIIIILLASLSAAKATCSNEEPPRLPKYHLIEKCHRSTLGVLVKANYTSLISCQRLGIEKKGLALNFSPPEAMKEAKRGDEPIEYTCEVLKCAEADGGVSLVNDTRYDYYSIYAKHLPNVNSTCIPGIGMFYLQSKRQNYSDAASECRNMSGSLADVISETRTDALAQTLAGAGLDLAYVGLASDNGTEFVSVSTGDTFECTTHRAWAPGHPKRRRETYGCVGVTRTKTWRSLPCRSKLPSLCELAPSGPYRRRGRIFKSRKRDDTLPESQANMPK